MSSQFTRKQNEISETALPMEMKIKDKGCAHAWHLFPVLFLDESLMYARSLRL